MGCLFSTEEAASSVPLLDAAPAASGAPPKFTKEASASGPPSSAKKVPTFVKKAAAAAGGAPAKREAGVGLFCQCGGSGSLVVLLPCNHHALCLHCAQFTSACPVCSAAITDSKPSFRVARPAAAPSEAAL